MATPRSVFNARIAAAESAVEDSREMGQKMLGLKQQILAGPDRTGTATYRYQTQLLFFKHQVEKAKEQLQFLESLVETFATNGTLTDSEVDRIRNNMNRIRVALRDIQAMAQDFANNVPYYPLPAR